MASATGHSSMPTRWVPLPPSPSERLSPDRRFPSSQQVNKLEITADKQLLAAAGNPHIRIFEVNSTNPQPVSSYDRHTGNVTAIGEPRQHLGSSRAAYCI